MSRPNAALRIAVPAPNPHLHGAEARPTAVPATREPARGAEGAIIEAIEAAGRDLVAGRVARPVAGGEPRHAPGTPAARIYQRGRSSMQSGRASESAWLLTFEPQYRTEIDFLMGWTASRDTLQQVELRFPTLDEAVAFARRRGLPYEVETSRRREVRPKSYAGNFRHDRLLPWTH